MAAGTVAWSPFQTRRRPVAASRPTTPTRDRTKMSIQPWPMKRSKRMSPAGMAGPSSNSTEAVTTRRATRTTGMAMATGRWRAEVVMRPMNRGSWRDQASLLPSAGAGAALATPASGGGAAPESIGGASTGFGAAWETPASGGGAPESSGGAPSKTMLRSSVRFD
jgi:hypothetical protein